MKKNFFVMLALVTLVSACNIAPKSDYKESNSIGKEQVNVLITADTLDVPYRIPAVATAPNGDLVVVADYRYSRQDIGIVEDGRIDIRARIGHNYGKEWGEVFTILTSEGADAKDPMYTTFGDPCIASDIEGNGMVMFCCAGDTSFMKGTVEKHMSIVRLESNDNGKSWSKPYDLAPQIFKLFEKASWGGAKSMFFTSGRVFQSRTTKVGSHHRLYVALVMIDANDRWVDFVLYSDDFGKEWKVLGGVEVPAITEGGDEAKIDELPNGNILISCRIKGGRIYNILTVTDKAKGEGTWAEQVISDENNRGTVSWTKACHGEIIILPVERVCDGEKMHLLLQSLPIGPLDKSMLLRTNVGFYYKPLQKPADYATPEAIAKDWEGRHIVTNLLSAYSTMCLQHNNKLAFVFEETTFCSKRGGGYTIVCKEYSVEEITNGAYRYCEH